MSNIRNRQEFRITVDGISLPPKWIVKINEALQKTILSEIALLDLRGNELVFSPIMARIVADDEIAHQMRDDNNGEGGGGGGGGGCHIRIVPKVTG